MESELILKAKNSYLTKEKFLKMIEDLNFDYVERADMQFITGFMIKTNKDSIEYAQSLGYNINIS